MSVTDLPCCFFIVFLFLSQTFHCLAVYNITSSSPLFANQTLVSFNTTFELGFFTPNATTGNQYVGIWYESISPRKVVWVANREKPVISSDELASLRIGTDGNLELVDGQQNTIWSTNIIADSNNSQVVLLDDGNLVLKDTNSGIIVWESFHHPSDTFLPGMEIGINVRTGDKRYVVSWKSETDPSPGNFVLGVTPEVPPQAMGWKNSIPYWRGGQWNKVKFIGIEDMPGPYIGTFTVRIDPKQGTIYLFMEMAPPPYLQTMFISPNGTLKFIIWDDDVKEWQTQWQAPSNLCQFYGACGSFGICRASDSPICSCLTGFVAKSSEEWNRENWTGGCTRETTLNCQRSTNTSSPKDKFLKMSNMKLPDLATCLTSITNDQECHDWCLNNCSCQAYSYVEIIGCMIWMERLMDMVKFNSSGEDLFIRLAHIDSGAANPAKILIISLTAVLIFFFIVGVPTYCLCKRRAKQKSLFASSNIIDKKRELMQEKTLREQLKYENKSELYIFSLDTILASTENFSVTLKLGQGGFGSVYKGKLEDGREIAVKRLSSSSVQGIQEFKNEIILISKLQHRNLVKLLGCCIEGDEKILVYQYLPNKSLDTFLFGNSCSKTTLLSFSENVCALYTSILAKVTYYVVHYLDATRKTELDWDKRFNIIQGIARGLMYLHNDSCLRVIHRDLKASNILLDQNMNPKISDFGLARIFQGTQVLVNTHKIVGTLGYMSPEYAMGGIFSEKSDVYSFGVLILEIVAGKKNSLVHNQGETMNFIFYAWQLWSQGEGLKLADETFVCKSSVSEVMKCIHIGLLCVQDLAAGRPNMSTVVLMLSGESNLPQPKQPTFTSHSWNTNEIQLHEQCKWSSNTITNSLIEGR